MKIFIKELKKGDKFKFNDVIYTVRQKFSDWKNDKEPYLTTTCGEVFYFEELEVDTVDSLAYAITKDDINYFLNLMVDDVAGCQDTNSLIAIAKYHWKLGDGKSFNFPEKEYRALIKSLLKIVKVGVLETTHRLAQGKKAYLVEINLTTLGAPIIAAHLCIGGENLEPSDQLYSAGSIIAGIDSHYLDASEHRLTDEPEIAAALLNYLKIIMFNV